MNRVDTPGRVFARQDMHWRLSSEPESRSVYFLVRYDIEAPLCGRKGEPEILPRPVARQRDPFTGICLDGRPSFV
jgi:hypothetical protein